MITDALLRAWFTFASWAVGLIPPMPADMDAFIRQTPLLWAEITTYVGYFAPVIPFSVIGGCLVVAFAGWILATVIQGARIVLSFATLGGGSV